MVRIRELSDIILLNFDATELTPSALVAIINNSHSFASSILLEAFIFLTVLLPLKPETLKPFVLIASK